MPEKRRSGGGIIARCGALQLPGAPVFAGARAREKQRVLRRHNKDA
jgi:hypothetical protein